MNTFSHLAAEHWVLGVEIALCLLLWFAAGRQSGIYLQTPETRCTALFWQVIAVIIAVMTLRAADNSGEIVRNLA